ncbi:MAG: YihY/virulence factor BrkB family protein [Halobacteriaceae archaeon]
MPRSLLDLLRAVAAEFRTLGVPFLAAAIAYYTFVSMVPLLLVGLAVGSALGGAALADYAVTATQDLLTPTGRDLLTSALTEESGRRPATVAGTALLLWSGLRVFRGLDVAFSRVYDTRTVKRLDEQVFEAVLVLAVGAVTVATVVGLAGVLPSLRSGPLAAVVSRVGLVVGLSAAFLPVYYAFPDTDVSLREALPGTVLAAVGSTVLTEGFRAYARVASTAELYGVLGGVVLLVTWFYVAAIVIILGAILNAVLAGRTDGDEETTGDEEEGAETAPDLVTLARTVERVETRLDEQTVDRADLEADLRRYVRRRSRRSHARGWGPYLVLLYGTAMTLGAFYYLSGAWAVLAMVVVWLSTLGLYALALLVGAGLSAVGVSGRLLDAVREWRR